MKFRLSRIKSQLIHYQASFCIRSMSNSVPSETPVIGKIVEGKASIIANESDQVFYNKVQILNRDLSIQVIRLFSETIQAERNASFEKKNNIYQSLIEKEEENKAINIKPPRPSLQGISILDALAATGLRSVRYIKEIENVRHITINDIDKSATDAIARNLIANNIPITEEVVDEASRCKKGVCINTGDGAMLMHNHKEPLEQYDVIDLDPYGSAAPFLDSAVQAVSNGGLLCVTCTDMSVFCGNYPEKCFALYGSMPIKAKYAHEQALRILLHTLETMANRYKRYIVPWVSMSIDYYMRVFVRVYESPAQVKLSSLKRSMVFQSLQCGSFYLQPLGEHPNPEKHFPNPSVVTNHIPTVCPETGGRIRMGGPIWSDPIHDPIVLKQLLERVSAYHDQEKETKNKKNVSTSTNNTDKGHAFVINTAPRLEGLLTAMSEELTDSPLYYYLPDIAGVLRSRVPPLIEIQAALINAGYKVSQFHHEPMAIKTNAPNQVVWDIMRSYCKAHPSDPKKPKKAKPVSDKMDASDMGHVKALEKCAKTHVYKNQQDEIAQKMLENPIVTKDISFEIPEVLRMPKKRVARFPPNPGKDI